MSNRSGYVEDGDMDQRDFAMWRGRVASAIRGKRGQVMLRELAAALDAMPEKRLVKNQLQTKDGDCCTLGCLAAVKGKDFTEYEDADEYDLQELNPELAEAFNVAECLVQEIEWENDSLGNYETPEKRWARMRAWVDDNLKKGAER